MKRRHVTTLILISLILIFTSRELFSGYVSVSTKQTTQGLVLVSERRLPNDEHSTKYEEVAKQPLEGSKMSLEHDHTRLPEVPEEANPPLRGDERQVSTKEEEGEREDVSDELYPPVQDGDSEQSGTTYYGKNSSTPICFVTSIFGASVEVVDKPPNVENIFWNDTAADYAFFLFTNLEELTSPGWTNIIITDLPYRRFITQSRWGKFVGWRHKDLTHCGTVIYADGYVKPQSKNGLAPFRKIADKVAQSEVGLAQVTHNMHGRRISRILNLMVENKKDVAANTEASWKWFQEQPDFDNKIPYYLNKWFGKFHHRDRTIDRSIMPCSNVAVDSSMRYSLSVAYDPSNLKFQEASSFFWDRYSQELDSWRDQPLWSYTLHHFNITPEVLFKKGKRRELFIMLPAATMGFGGHIHGELNDQDAALFRKNQTEKQAA
jgi:hypothetical protein